MSNSINSAIFDLNKVTLAQDLHLASSYGTDYPEFVTNFLSWINSCGSKINADLLDCIKLVCKKFTGSEDIGNVRGVVYFFVYKNCVIYIGSTSTNFTDRYKHFPKTKLFEEFFRRVNGNLEVYIYPVKNFKQIEAETINSASTNRIITCNVKCENFLDYLNKIDKYRSLTKCTLKTL